ncbi:thioredoxin family protein [Sandarakinorhabdus sp.]|uniref:protein-disulfide reductase DsbD family protein n=1 Tax=Sandarakinorhabdus sp. TaxID=1916663 RepID=UPI00286DA395|nr:thioredoxin family protein [Sandarakinorhabdus sp.]
MIRHLATAFVLLASAPLAAQSISEQPHTRAELIAESRSPAPGKPLTVGIQLTPRQGWHTYWINPGDAGAPTRAAWTLPEGTPTPAELSYPVPGTLIVSGLMNYVYEKTNVLLTEVAVPADLAGGKPYPVSVKVDWLVCSLEQCVPESAELTLPLTTGSGAADPEMGFRVANARNALPRTVDWPARWSATKTGQGVSRVAIAVPVGSIDKVRSAYFYPLQDGVIGYAAPQSVTRSGDMLRIETDAADPGPSGTVTGLLRITREGDSHDYGFTISANAGAVPQPGASLTTAAPQGAGPGLPLILLGAVLGGVLLNIMPCVFPILSLKALALAKGNVDAAVARRDAVAYAAGVILVCAALGGLVLVLRAAGAQVGWAFQLQDPRVIAGLLLLMTAIALNLAGLFEINLTSGNLGQDAVAKGGALGSFATGALAAFVATPCTGPFMAGALGASLVLPPVQAVSVFAGLGFGLALPFLLVGFVPALRKRLPRPGAWMTRFKAILSIPMFLTVLALAWVLGRQAGVEGLTAGLAGALALGLLLWWVGQRQHAGGTAWIQAAAAAAVVALAIATLPIGAPAEAAGTSAPAGLSAQRFSPARLAALRAEGRPVFLYMTADWCLTCKVNEKGAMADARVASAFKAKGIAVLEGDWTRGDPTISDWLAREGRAGVPVYVFYSSDGKSRELSQLLTVSELLAL